MQQRILIIEDSPGIRASLRWALQVAGYLVAEAADGIAGLEILRAEPPDLVLLDLSMPRMNGLVLLRELSQLNPRPPTRVIVTTAHRSTPLVVEAMQLGADNYLVKPIEAHELREAVTSLLGAAQPHDPSLA